MSNNDAKLPVWWRAAHTRQLQPLSEEFLTRSPAQVPSHSWRCLPRGVRHA